MSRATGRPTGRPPKPTALKILAGDRKDRIPRSEPRPDPGKVVAPPLTRRARIVWNRLAPNLIATKVLTRTDVDLFAGFCEAVVMARTASADISRRGILVKGAEQQLVKNPAVQIHRDAMTTLTSIGPQFGIGAANRSKIATEPEAKTHGQTSRFFTGS
jgi:P27 family predicted phage terminase small subunit